MVLLVSRCIPHRYVVVTLCFILMLINVGYRACFALMATQISFFNSSSNGSTHLEESSIFPNCTTMGTSRSKVVDWSGSTVSLFNTAYFAGQFVMSIPAGALVMRYSPKRIFGLTCLLTSILLLLLPVATDAHVSVTYIIRTVQGMLEATSIPAMNSMISVWAGRNEKARLINFAYAGVYLSPAVAMFAAGATNCYVSWDSIMYIYGSLGAGFCLPWMVSVASNPLALSKHVNKKQNKQLPQPPVTDTSTTVKTVSQQKIPWCKLFSSLPVLAIWVAAFCRNFTFGLLVTEVQQYFKDVHDLPASMNGLMSGLPQVFMVIFMLLGAYAFDVLVKKEILSVTRSRKLAQCSGYGIQGICSLALGFVEDQILACTLLSIGAAFSGFAISGYQTNILDLAPKYTGPLTGISRTGMLGSVLSTTLVAQLTGDSHSLTDWQHVFIIAGVVHLAGVIFYGVFASGNLQSWAEPVIEMTIPAVEYIKTPLEVNGSNIPAVKYNKTPSDNDTECEIVLTNEGKLEYPTLSNGHATNDTHIGNGVVTTEDSSLPNGHSNHYLPSSFKENHLENIPRSDSPSFYSIHL